jgi:hypothetical protein
MKKAIPLLFFLWGLPYVTTTLTNTKLIPGGTLLHGNDLLMPSDNTYPMKLYSYPAQLVADSGPQSIGGTSPVDRAHMTPSSAKGVAEGYVNLASPAGNNTFSGMYAFPGAAAFDAGANLNNGEIVSGTSTNIAQVQITSADTINKVLYVGGDITIWAGFDIGAQINSAYAALPAAGGKIVILPQSGGGCYSFSTTMSFTTNLKTVALEGLGPSTCLQFTPTSGTAISLNWGGSHQGAPFMRMMSFFGSGAANAAVGIQLGGTSSNGVTDDIALDHVYSGRGTSAGGWGTFISIPARSGNGAFDVSMDHVGILNNATGVSTNALILRITNSQIAQNTSCGISVTGGEVELFGNDIDPGITGTNNEVGVCMSGSTVAVFAFGNHWEAQTCCTGQQLVSSTATNGTLGIYGGDFLYDQTSGSQMQMITWRGDTLIIDGVRLFTSGITFNEVVNFTGTFGNAWLRFKNTTGNISAPYGGSAMPIHNASYDQSATWSAVDLATGTGSAVFGTNPTFAQSMYVTESGQCTMSKGACTSQALTHAYSTPPRCFGSWTGRGTLTGILKFPDTVNSVTPASSAGTDTAVVNWECHAANGSF